MKVRHCVNILMKLVFSIVLFSFIDLSSFAQSSDLTEFLKTTDMELQRAVAERNIDKIISFYSDDAALMGAAEPIVTGKENIYEEWSHILNIPDFKNTSTLKQIEVSACGDLAYTMGTYLATMIGENDEEVVEPGKWVTVWKRNSYGQWRIVVDIYNTDISPPDHK